MIALAAQPHDDSSDQPFVRTLRGTQKSGTSSSDSESLATGQSSPDPAPAKVVPELIPVPTKGLPAGRYWLNKKLKHPEWVPALGKKEKAVIVERQAELDIVWQAELQQYNRERANYTLLELCHRVRHLRVGFANSKGGGATTTATAWSVSVFGDSTRVPSLTAADFNPARGTLAERLGRAVKETIDLRGVVTNSEKMEQFQEYSNLVGFTRYGVQVIGATSIIKKDDKLDGASAATALDVINPNSRYTWFDTPNDITTDVSLAVFDNVDVLVFTANVGVHDSMRHLATSMDTLREQGFTEKVDHSIVCISNIPPGKTVEDYRMYLDEVNMFDQKERDLAHLHKGRLIGIPRDEVIDNDSIVNLEDVDPMTYQAFQNLDIAILQSAPQFRKDRSSAEVAYNLPRPQRELFTGFEHYQPVPA